MKEITNKDRIKRLGLSIGNYCYGHECVDLGLPSGLLWAKCNVGAEKETDFGNHYQHGKGRNTYEETRNTEHNFKNFIDTASEVMGGKWRMPTKEEFKELIANSNYKWCEIDGVYGMKFCSKYDDKKYVFFPACGGFNMGLHEFSHKLGFYWSASIYSLEPNDAHVFFFNDEAVYYTTSGHRFFGFSVRGVIEKI